MSATDRTNVPLRGIGAPFVAAVLIGLVTSQAFAPAISPAIAQASGCDCSCESYTRLRQIMEEFKAQQDAGEPASIPPEIMQMSQCAGQCAMAWAQCENPDMDLSGMREAQQRALRQAQQGGDDYSGDNAIARERAINERSIGETEKNLQPDETAVPRERLTAEYLEGMWCSVYGGQEKAQWRFHANGSYEVGLPAGRGWAMQPSGDSLDEYHERFERLVEMQPDGFTTEHGSGRRNVFTRGRCD